LAPNEFGETQEPSNSRRGSDQRPAIREARREEPTIMVTTTEYGSWINYADATYTEFADNVRAALGDFAGDFDVPALTEAYADAINAELEPAGIALLGSGFYGPHPVPDKCWRRDPCRDRSSGLLGAGATL
jgi:hypothetical protein